MQNVRRIMTNDLVNSRWIMVVVWSVPNGLWWWYGQFQMGYGGGLEHVQCIA